MPVAAERPLFIVGGGVASGFGVKSYRVENPEKLRATLELAVEANEPALVDVLCQPLEEARAPVSEWIARAGVGKPVSAYRTERLAVRWRQRDNPGRTVSP